MWRNSLKEGCSSKSQMVKPGLFSRKGDQLSLSGAALADLIEVVLSKGASFRFQAKGFSMTPFIGNGDVIVVSPPSGDFFCLGEVVAFIQPETGKLVVHRVVGKVRGAFLIKGDNMSDPDGVIPRPRILGYVTRVERDGKEVSLGLGLERILIAFLTRRRRFLSLPLPILRFINPIVRRLTS